MNRTAVVVLLIVLLLPLWPCCSAGEAGPPLDLRAERDGSRILLSWAPPAGNLSVLHYNVYRGTGPNNISFYDSVDANFTAGYDSEVVRGWTYYYAISVNTTEGEGPLSEVVVVLPPSDGYPAAVMTGILVVAAVTLLFAFWKGRGRE